MGKFTTDNIEDLKTNPDLIYLSPRDLHRFRELNIIRCKDCRSVLNEGVEAKWKNRGYCDEYCYEMSNPPKIHGCVKCGDSVESFTYKRDVGSHKKGAITHTYPKYCKNCSPYNKEKNLELLKSIEK